MLLFPKAKKISSREFTKALKKYPEIEIVEITGDLGNFQDKK